MTLPEPYWQDEARGLRLFHGDCRDILPCFADGECGSVITDPPYANGTDYGETHDDRDSLRCLVEDFMPEAIRVSGRVVLTPGVGNMWLYPEPTWTMCWADPAGQGSGPWGFASWQPVLCFGPDPYLQAGEGRRSDTIVKRWLRNCRAPLP